MPLAQLAVVAHGLRAQLEHHARQSSLHLMRHPHGQLVFTFASLAENAVFGGALHILRQNGSRYHPVFLR